MPHQLAKLRAAVLTDTTRSRPSRRFALSVPDLSFGANMAPFIREGRTDEPRSGIYPIRLLSGGLVMSQPPTGPSDPGQYPPPPDQPPGAPPPPPGYGPPPPQPPGSPPEPGTGPPPPDQPPSGYGAPPPGYGAPPPGYGAPPAGYGAPPPQLPPGPSQKNTKVLVAIIGGFVLLVGLIVGIAASSHETVVGGAQPSAAALPSSLASGAPSGGAPSGGAPSGGAPSGGAPSGGAPSGGAPSAAPTSYPGCTSHSCIAAYLDQNLTGLVALDNAVSTKVTCYVSTVVYYAAAGTYSADCTVDYSDGSSAYGTGNLLASGGVTFEPS